MDSWVNMYDRTKGFIVVNPRHQDDIANLPSVATAYSEERQAPSRSTSNQNLVENWHKFEMFVVMNYQGHDYTNFLLQCKNLVPNLKFVPAPVTFVVAYARYLRGNGPKNSWDKELKDGREWPGWTVTMVLSVPTDPCSEKVPMLDKNGNEVIGRNLCYNSIKRIKGVMVRLHKDFDMHFDTCTILENMLIRQVFPEPQYPSLICDHSFMFAVNFI